MFTGLVYGTAIVHGVESVLGGKRFLLHASLGDEFLARIKLGSSIACDGVCLTIESFKEIKDSIELSFFASDHTLSVTTLNSWQVSDLVNIEPSLRVGDELGGHFVSGHIDTLGNVSEVEEHGEVKKISFSFADKYKNLLIYKGSIAVNGVSLTVNEISDPKNQGNTSSFSVTLIPLTLSKTNLHLLKPSSPINLEFDLLGKYAVGFKNSM